ncbi:MAG TPA: prepilin peptidase [Gammaproteobacteria bacterium]|nr:prepilin peptidase [Gammaproteobacteria bacterium]
MASDLAVLSFALMLFSAAVSDILRLTIPNRICLGIVLVYPAFVLTAPVAVHWPSALGVASLALCIGFTLYSLRGLGAGDAKLFAATSLWAGSGLIIELTLLTTLAGGVIALFLWLQNRVARAPSVATVFLSSPDPGIARQSMPYGAAIAVGGLYVAFTLLRVN